MRAAEAAEQAQNNQWGEREDGDQAGPREVIMVCMLRDEGSSPQQEAQPAPAPMEEDLRSTTFITQQDPAEAIQEAPPVQQQPPGQTDAHQQPQAEELSPPQPPLAEAAAAEGTSQQGPAEEAPAGEPADQNVEAPSEPPAQETAPETSTAAETAELPPPEPEPSTNPVQDSQPGDNAVVQQEGHDDKGASEATCNASISSLLQYKQQQQAARAAGTAMEGVQEEGGEEEGDEQERQLTEQASKSATSEKQGQPGVWK